MSGIIHYDDVVRMLRGAIAHVREHHATLSRLDSVGGDGDHGTTMVRAMGVMAKAIDVSATHEIKDLLHDVGWAIMGVDGGATGPLFGTLFMGMAEPAAGRESLNAGDLALLFEAGLAAVRRQTKAQVGDKTLMDALVPAVEAMRNAADAGGNFAEMLRRGTEAAIEGAESTKALQAKFGRARNIKEKSIGFADPGATSVSFLFRGFSEGHDS